MRRRPTVLLAAALAIGAVTVARADHAAEARFHDELARSAYARRDFDAALAHFLDAHAAAPNPTSLYNIALAADLARREVLAFHFFEDYLATSDDDETRRTEAARRRDRLAGRLALVRVESDPPGAGIVVDRAELGDWGATPRTIAVSPGPHRILLRREDHEDVELQVVARTGELSEATARLTQRTGTLVVEAEPPEARVAVLRDGVLLVDTRSGEVTRVPVGACVVRVEHPGHHPAETALRVVPDGEARVRVVATPVPAPRGRLLVRTTDVTARVLVDGVPRGLTPLVLSSEPVGRHRVELEAEGHLPWSQPVEIREGRSTHLTVSLTRAR
ncbi:MAG: PEGA domain-containing protein [Sandaracinaceae bacterium]|nr:PEGA domain-containing protein [Sandaracinaceae bacterium]